MSGTVGDDKRTISFSVDADVYEVVERRASARGMTPSQLAKTCVYETEVSKGADVYVGSYIPIGFHVRRDEWELIEADADQRGLTPNQLAKMKLFDHVNKSANKGAIAKLRELRDSAGTGVVEAQN